MSRQQEELYGKGIDLDEDFDISPSKSGDLEISAGVTELEKDIRFKIYDLLDGIRGRVMRERLKRRLRYRIEELLTDDDRITSVEEIDITAVDDRIHIMVKAHAIGRDIIDTEVRL